MSGDETGGRKVVLDDGCSGGGRVGGFTAGKNMEIGDGYGLAGAGIEPAQESGENRVHGNIEIARFSEPLGELGAVGWLIAPGAGIVKSGDEREVFRCMVLSEVGAEHQDFFHVARRLTGAPRGAPAVTSLHGDGAPGFAGAVAVDGARDEVTKHLGGRHDDDAHVFFRIDPGGNQPLPKL